MTGLFHVTSALNRDSILAHGLDWTRVGAAPGIAGSLTPEEEGVFLCRDEFEADFFVRINNTGGPVDVWAVAGIKEDELITAGYGFGYFGPDPAQPGHAGQRAAGRACSCEPPPAAQEEAAEEETASRPVRGGSRSAGPGE